MIYTRSLPNLRRALSTLTDKDRTRLAVVAGLNFFLGIVDLIGVASVGVLGALAVVGIEGSAKGTRLNSILSIAKIGNLTFQTQAAILGIVAGLSFIFRTIASIYINKKITRYFSRKGARLSIDLLSKILNQPLDRLERKSTQEYIFVLSDGVASLTLGILGTLATLSSDLILLSILCLGILAADFWLGITIVFSFSIVGIVLTKISGKQAREIGKKDAYLNKTSNVEIYEYLTSFRELYAGNRLSSAIEKFRDIKFEHGEILAQRQFLPIMSKYVIESSVILLALLVSATQFLTGNAGHAIGSLSIFLGAGSRIAPALLRAQQSVVQLRVSSAPALLTLDLIDDLRNTPILNSESQVPEKTIHPQIFTPRIEIRNLTYRYEGQNFDALSCINLQIEPGQFVAIVGPSGAGKSTLVDALLGLLTIQSGEALISGQKAKEAISIWPGEIAYVPQTISLSNKSIYLNILNGLKPKNVSEKRLMSLLEEMQLADLIQSLPHGLNSLAGERGQNLSGGQAQRIGIARALLTNPKLLILDEATSSLDGKTEQLISNEILSLRGETTVVAIAHRLNTVLNADLVVYMERGKVIKTGSFEEIRSAVPGFDVEGELEE